MHTYRDPEIDLLWTTHHTIGVWTAVEQMVASEQARRGLIPLEAAEAIEQARPPSVDRVRDLEQTTHHDVAAFVAALVERVDGVGRPYVHVGLTSSDLVDTANAVRAVRINQILSDAAYVLMGELQTLAAQHADTPRLARTHGQAAEPIAFGIQLNRLRQRVGRARAGLARRPLPMKLSGPVGLNTYNPPEIEDKVARVLGLEIDGSATQVVGRDYYADWAYSMWGLVSAVEQIALEVRLGSQTEIGELAESFGDGQVGSTAMPHKRNPITAERLAGLGRLARGYLSPVLETAGALWGERDISNSSVERTALRDLSGLAAYMLRQAGELVSRLQVDEVAMSNNLSMAFRLPSPAATLWLNQRIGCLRETTYESFHTDDREDPIARSVTLGDRDSAKHLEWYWRNAGIAGPSHGAVD